MSTPSRYVGPPVYDGLDRPGSPARSRQALPSDGRGPSLPPGASSPQGRRAESNPTPHARSRTVGRASNRLRGGSNP